MKKYLNLILSLIALGTAMVLAVSHMHYEGVMTFVWVCAALVLGYMIGRVTCHIHRGQYGVAVTLGIFVALNFIHSTLDGSGVATMNMSAGLAVLAHEAARQPAMYVVLLGMLAPFAIGRLQKVLLVIFSVTGIWLLGVLTGRELYTVISSIEWLEHIAELAIFLFIGDIVHHVYEEYTKITSPDTCCH